MQPTSAAESPPLSFQAEKTSLDKYLGDSPENLEGAESSLTTFSLCPDLRIRQASVVHPDATFAGYDVLVGCGRWSCPVCGKLKLWVLRKRIQLGKPTKFLTLTTKPAAGETPRTVFERTSPKIKKLFDHFRKKGREISYCRILESTKEGFPHYHFAMRSRYLPQPEISKVWEDLTGASVVDIRSIRRNTISYISKYISKSTHVNYTRQRITFSRCWPKSEKPESKVLSAENWSSLHSDDIPKWVCSAEGYVRDLGKNVVSREYAVQDEPSSVWERVNRQWGRGTGDVKQRERSHIWINMEVAGE